MATSPKPGEVYFVDLGLAAKSRNILIVSIADDKAPLAVATGLALTRRYHQTPYEVALPKLPWMRDYTFVNAQSLQGVGLHELQRLTGKLDNQVMQQVQAALRAWLGL